MKQVACDGQIWSYEDVGGHGGITGGHGDPPLLVLHGWGRNGSEWARVARELSAWSGRKIYLLDLPGFGGSSLAQVSDIFEYSELVYEYCKYMDIKKVILLGHSLGGRIGIVLAARHPELIEKLILIDSAGVKPRSVKRIFLNILSKIFMWVPRFIRAIFLARVMDEDYRNSPALRDLYRAVVGQDLTSLLSGIKCETDVVWGENDPILPLYLTKIYRNYLKNSRTRVVWGAGHDPHLTHFDQTLSILQEATE